MRRYFLSLLACFLVVSVVGCGNNRERGKNKNQDRPVSADKKAE